MCVYTYIYTHTNMQCSKNTFKKYVLKSNSFLDGKNVH